MAQRSHVPKFGNWESGENVPYTVYFDKARKGKTGGKMINPNDPQENMGMFSEEKPSIQAPPFRAGEPEVKVGQGMLRPKQEDGDFRRTDSPARHDVVGRRAINEPSQQRYGDRETSKRTAQQGGDRSIEQSPLHAVYQPKAGGRGSGLSSENIPGLAPSTPNRTRLKPSARGDNTPERGAAVPKFGAWDENNPASADGFTHIFNKVREEKHGMTNVVTMPADRENSHNRYQPSRDDTKGCGCFSWLGKK